jgi:hypothetical protein
MLLVMRPRSPAFRRMSVTRVSLPATALSGIDFGAPAAERDIERGLEDYFVESEIYNRVRVGSKRIVIGARGIGKSAIFQVLARRERDAGSYVIELSPEDYSYELLSQTMASEDHGSWAKLGAYAVAWKYLIYVLIMKEISKKRIHLKKGIANEIYKYVRDNHSNQQASTLSSLVSYLKRLEGIKIGKYEATIKARELEKLYKLEEIHHLLPALKEIVSHRRVIVLVDELDRGWDSSEDARAFVAGLFQACISVNSIHDNLRVYMSLRQELYDDVPALYDDAQKYRDLIETISWNDSSLLNLMAKRIRHSMPALAAADDETCWNSLFYAIPGSRGNGSFRYMIDRTLYRPREIIQFCTQAIECCRESQPGIPLRATVIREAERIYSAERTKDIAAEHRFQHPGLISVMEAFRARTRTLDREDLEFMCLELITGDIPSTGTGSWLTNCTPDDLIKILWDVGFLSAEAGRDVSGHQASGIAYLGNHQARHLNMATARRFQVHPMFHAYLRIETPGPLDGSR